MLSWLGLIDFSTCGLPSLALVGSPHLFESIQFYSCFSFHTNLLYFSDTIIHPNDILPALRAWFPHSCLFTCYWEKFWPSSQCFPKHITSHHITVTVHDYIHFASFDNWWLVFLLHNIWPLHVFFLLYLRQKYFLVFCRFEEAFLGLSSGADCLRQGQHAQNRIKNVHRVCSLLKSKNARQYVGKCTHIA